MSVLAVIASFLAIFVSIVLLILGKFIDALTVPRSFIFFFELSSIVKDLQVTREDLRARKEDIDKQIVDAERQSRIPTSQVKGWKKDVDDIMPEIETVINEYNGCADEGAFSYICSMYSVAIKCAEYHEKVKDLLKRASFDTGPMENKSNNIIPTTYEVPGSLKMKYEMALDFVRNDNSVNVIGIWGMGGVGKTSLVKKMCDFCSGLPIFDHVIWVVASSEQSNVTKVESEIIEKLRLVKYGNAQSQARIIHNFLRNKNFLLFIDDLWEAVDLHEVGVPNTSDGNCRTTRKVVFTTRQLYVCGNMEAKERIKVECLNWEESWVLFKEKVGEQVIQSHLAISDHAKDVAKECKGLPLALITIGRAMSTKRNPNEWKSALNLMRKSQVHDVSGTKKNEMQRILKISYDFLDSEVLKKCFLSFSMLPEDENLRKYDLIDWWQGLGIIDNFESMNDTYLMGISLIGSLQAACLLEDCENSWYNSHDGEYVKMHDVLRDLAIWIASDCGENNNKWIMKTGIRLHQGNSIALDCSEAECISIMRSHFTELPFGITHCPNLHTLILPRNKLTCESMLSCFHNFRSLKYLDLFENNLNDFPEPICDLAELQYLNLSCNHIEIIPEKLGNLKKLKYLILGRNPIRNVPRGVFSKLVKLLKLDLYCDGNGIYRLDLEELKCLEKKLLCLRITVWGEDLIKLKLLSATNIEALCIWNLQDKSFRFMSLMSNNYNSNLGRCLKNLTISHSHDGLLEEIVFHKGEIYDYLHSQSMSMEVFHFYNLSALRRIIWIDLAPKELFANLNDICFLNCSVLEHVTWVIHLPSLKFLRIIACDSMRTVINDCDSDYNYDLNSSSLTFPSLKILHIHEMPNLQKLSTCSLAFPQLQCLTVHGCPLLTTLSFELLAYPKIQGITGESEWWNKLEWENDDSISHFNKVFRSW